MWKSTRKENQVEPGPSFGTDYLTLRFGEVISLVIVDQLPELRIKCFAGKEEFYLHLDFPHQRLWIEEEK